MTCLFSVGKPGYNGSAIVCMSDLSFSFSSGKPGYNGSASVCMTMSDLSFLFLQVSQDIIMVVQLSV